MNDFKDEKETKSKVRSFYKLLLQACDKYDKFKKPFDEIYIPINEQYLELTKVPGLIPESSQKIIQNAFDGVDEVIGFADDFCSTLRGEFEPILKRLEIQIEEIAYEIRIEKTNQSNVGTNDSEIPVSQNLGINTNSNVGGIFGISTAKLIVSSIGILSLVLFAGYIQYEISLTEETDLLNKAREYFWLGKYESALIIYDRILEQNQNHIQALTDKGVTLSVLEQKEESLSFYDKALEVDPDYGHALSAKGLVLSELNRPQEAMEFVDKALEVDPDSVQALYYKGLVLSELNRPQEAMEFVDKALEVDPDSVQALYYKGLVLSELNRPQEAMEFVDKALEVDPDFLYGLKWKKTHLNP